MSRTHQRKKSEWTYLPEKLVGDTLKHYSAETARGPYWKPYIDLNTDEPKIEWMTYKGS